MDSVVFGTVEGEGGDAGTLDMDGGISIHGLTESYNVIVITTSGYFEHKQSPVARGNRAEVETIAAVKQNVILVNYILKLL